MNQPDDLRAATTLPDAETLLARYGCGAIPLAGSDHAFYDRQLVFDLVLDPKQATARDQYEAFAHSIRDVAAQRWVLTEQTYARERPKRINYLSMDADGDPERRGLGPVLE
jgi:starch phosphorylase